MQNKQKTKSSNEYNTMIIAKVKSEESKRLASNSKNDYSACANDIVFQLRYSISKSAISLGMTASDKTASIAEIAAALPTASPRVSIVRESLHDPPTI